MGPETILHQSTGIPSHHASLCLATRVSLTQQSAGEITSAQVREIAEKKMVDLNANDVEAAMKQVAGTARSMGVEVRD